MNTLKNTLLSLVLLAFPVFSQDVQPQIGLTDTLVNNPRLIPIPDSIIIEEMNFKDADIRDVLRGIGAQFGLNIWLAPDVSARLPVNFKKIPVKTAVDFIITKYNFNYKVRNGIVEVFRPAPPPPPPPPEVKILCDIKYADNKISFDIKDAPLDTVVRRLVRETKQNIIVEKGLSGQLTALLNDIDLEKGLIALFENNGYEITRKNDLYSIARPVWNSSNNDQPTARKKLSILVDSTRVKMEVTDADLADIINIISTRSGISIIVYGGISGKISAKLEKYIEIDDALKYLLSNTNFVFWKNKDVYFIGDKNMKVSNNAELVKLRYMKAEEVIKLLPETITQNTKVNVLKEQNGLLVVGSYEYIVAAKDFITIVDKPIAQILIEALVVDFSITKGRDMGLRIFSGSGGNGSNSFYPGIDITATGSDINKIGEKKLSDYFTLEQITNLPANFRAQISALESNNLANVLSTPQVATLNGNTATILIGTTQYYKLRSSTLTTGTTPVVTQSEHFELVEANVTLSVTPFVTGEREVTVEINPIFHIPGGAPNDSLPPPINKREIKSVVRLKDGETYVLGGLIEDREVETFSGIPFLSRIPFLGALFRKTHKDHSKSRMMIFLTPHIFYGSEGAVDREKAIKELQ